ncbi:Acetylspermidine deacetylase; Deacetylases, including yeast histone deacetylase and acetoin utilization protein [hydrothermal vent metagenome]|uniref:Acetylspermidine deacetylase Deacetylases, including yeast histone deacetylase and acetoin utilization protein n=1 Tax=hydrothermal vent metagenome TaxID=652676 RepID=A0A3B0TBE7_9ZZZZ
MTTRLYSHPACLSHQAAAGHPERPDRLRALTRAFANPAFDAVERRQAPRASEDDIARAHSKAHIDHVRTTAPRSGLARLDADTYMSPGSWEAAFRGAGAVVEATRGVLAGEATNAFCAVRPPGHHAEREKAMGFCLLNNVAIAARYARQVHGLDRVAIVDFDVHHGNGTQEIFHEDPAVLYASTHQMPLFPGTGSASETGVGNIFNAPLNAGDGGAEFQDAITSVVLPALDAFAPQLVIISAGFDAHERDPLGQLRLSHDDFAWVTRALMSVADTHAGGRVVSVLEGGYDLTSLARSASAHLATLMTA